MLIPILIFLLMDHLEIEMVVQVMSPLIVYTLVVMSVWKMNLMMFLKLLLL